MPHLVLYLVLFCYRRDFKLPLSDNNQAGGIEAYNPTSRYLLFHKSFMTVTVTERSTDI